MIVPKSQDEILKFLPVKCMVLVENDLLLFNGSRFFLPVLLKIYPAILSYRRFVNY